MVTYQIQINRFQIKKLLFSKILTSFENHSQIGTLTIKNIKHDLLRVLRSELQHKGKVSNFVNRLELQQDLHLSLDKDMQMAIKNNFYDFLASKQISLEEL